MEIKKYIEIIEKTAVFPTTVSNFGVAYCWLGIQDELREFFEKIDDQDWKGLNGEKGDVMWYLCALCQNVGINFEDLMEQFTDFHQKEDWRKISREQIFMRITSFSGNIKKFYRDGKELNLVILTSVLEDIINVIFYHSTKEDILGVLEANYDKLIARRATNTVHGDGDYREKELKYEKA